MIIIVGSRRLLLLMVFIWTLFGFGIHSTLAEPDYWPTRGWRISTPEEQGMNSGKIVQMLQMVEEEYPNIGGIAIIRNSYLVTDIFYAPFHERRTYNIYSCTKSITSSLIGIALDKGHFKSIDQPLLDFFPERNIANLDPRKQSMTIKHLLTMTSGLDTKDSYSYRYKDLINMRGSDDWVQYVLDLPIAAKPGTKFEYSNNVSFLLAALLQKVTRRSGLDFGMEYLIRPLGINKVRLDSNPQSINHGYANMWLTAGDMAKIGFLYLHEGRWEDKQIIPKKWIKAATTKQTPANIAVRYGYQWWIDADNYYYAAGYGGQRIFVIPDKNMVVVFVGLLLNKDISLPNQLLKWYIIPAVESEKPLPANAQNTENLRTMMLNASKKSDPQIIWLSKKEGMAQRGEFIRTASPALKIQYPLGSKKNERQDPKQIMAMKTFNGSTFSVSIAPMLNGITLADVDSQYLIPFFRTIGSDVRLLSTQELSLRDGTKAFKSAISWKSRQGYELTSILVSAQKEGKLITAGGTTILELGTIEAIAESLTFSLK